MNKNKIRGLKWNLKKLRGSVLHLTLKDINKNFTCTLKRNLILISYFNILIICFSVDFIQMFISYITHSNLIINKSIIP